MEISYEELLKLSDCEIRKLWGDVVKILFEKEIIRTKNFTGEFGEYDAVKYFCGTENLPNLSLAHAGTKHYDAIDEDGKTYSIKSITRNQTGTFSSTKFLEDGQIQNKDFDYLLICKYDDYFNLEAIYRLTNEEFKKNATMHKTMGRYKISLNKKMIAKFENVYKK